MRRIYRMAMPGSLAAAAGLLVLFCGGCFLRTPALLKAANEPSKVEVTPPPRVTADRIERIVRLHGPGDGRNLARRAGREPQADRGPPPRAGGRHLGGSRGPL
jgi:hypothetical protein